MNKVLFITILVLSALAIGASFLLLQAVPLWLQLRLAGVPVSLMGAYRMSRTPPGRALAITAIVAQKHKLMVSLETLEAQQRAGGNPSVCVSALVEARRLGVDTYWEQIAGWDLDGLDPLHLINDAVHPPAPDADNPDTPPV